MITRNGLISLLILLAGFCAGFVLSRQMKPAAISEKEEGQVFTSLSWDKEHFGSDSLLVARMGLFLESFPELKTKTRGRPPVNSIIQWKTLGASSCICSHVYAQKRDEFKVAPVEGLEALRAAIALKDMMLEVEDRVEQHHGDFELLLSSLEYGIELARLLDYYRQFIMHYYRWLDTGDHASASQYKIAQGQFKATLDYFEGKYGDEPSFVDLDFGECKTAMASISNTPRSIRWARVLSVITLFLLLMGIPGFIRDRAHRKFSGTLFFSSIFRPYHISTLDAWHGTGRLLILQMSIYLLSMVVFSSFTSLLFPLVTGILGLVYLLGFMLLVRPGRRFKECGIALLGPMLALVILLMLPVAVRGPHWFWFQFWTSGLFRTLFFGLFFMSLFRMFQVHYLMAGRWGRAGTFISFSALVAALALPLLLTGLTLRSFGLEESLAALNEELLLFPTGLAENVGIAAHLKLSPDLPLWLIFMASGFILGGLLLYLTGLRLARKRK